MRDQIRRSPCRSARVHQAGAWLLLLTALLSVDCGRDAETAAPAGASISFTIGATVPEIMEAIVAPASDAIFDAVVYSNGTLERSPQTDDDWMRVRLQALALAESGNLLMLPGRAERGGDWIELSQAMSAEALRIARATETKDPQQLLETGSAVYRTCVACHTKYAPES